MRHVEAYRVVSVQRTGSKTIRFDFEPQQGSLWCILGQDTIPSQYLCPFWKENSCKKTSGETKLIEGSEDSMKTCNELPKLDSNYSPFHFMIWKSTVGTLESTTL